MVFSVLVVQISGRLRGSGIVIKYLCCGAISAASSPANLSADLHDWPSV